MENLMQHRKGTKHLDQNFQVDTDLTRFEEGIPQYVVPTNRRVLRLFMPQEAEPLVLMDVKKVVFGRGAGPDKIDLSLQYANMLGVSRFHAELVYNNGYYVLADLESSNGTFINGYKLVPNKSYILESNDQIRLGHFVIVVSFI